MNLFKNLRKRLVHKLLRPEDGYTFTDFVSNEPIKFYYEEDTDQYFLYMSPFYFVPTLTGWRAYVNECHPKEIPFKKWVYGILGNVCDEYSARLDNISLSELKTLKDYTNEESSEKFVITKKSFCEVVNALESYWTNLRALEGILNVYFERGMMMDIIDRVVDALEEELEPQFYDPELYFNIDEDPLIMRWLTGLESDRTVDGKLLASAEDLYDYLVEKRNEKNISETT